MSFEITCSLAVLALGLVAAHGAQAQSADEATPIIVTAASGSDSVALDQSPVNAVVLHGRDLLTTQDHANLADLLNASLGSVTVSNASGSPYQSDVSYRGFQATSLLGAPTGLSVWFDGVRMNEPFGAVVNWDMIALDALDSVSVLPGANPLFGLNTLGGALVLTSANGADHPGVNVAAEAGSWSRQRLHASAGGVVAGTGLDWFVAGNHDVSDGPRWFTHTRVDQGYGKLRWGAGSGAAARQLDLAVTWASTALNGTQGLPLSWLDRPQQAYTAPDTVANRQWVINLSGALPLATGVRLSGNGYYRWSGARGINSNASLDDACGDTRQCPGNAPAGTALDLYQVNPWAPGTVQASNFMAYAGGLPLHDYNSNIDTSLVTARTAQHILGGNALLDLDWHLFGFDHDFNLGGNIESASVTYDQNTALAALVAHQAVALAGNPAFVAPGGAAISPLVNQVALHATTTGANLFVRDAVPLAKGLTLTLSLSETTSRVTLGGTNTTWLGINGQPEWTATDGQIWYNPAYLGAVSWQTSAIAGASPGSALVAFAAPAGGVAAPEVLPVSGAHHWSRLNPAAGLAWSASPGLNLFANWSEAMRAPTAIELACADPAHPCALPTGFNGDPALAAVVAHALEAGGRGRIGRHWQWNAAVYATRLSNDIQFDFTPAGLGYFANVGATRRRGYELAVSGTWRHGGISASYGRVAATFQSSFVDAHGDLVQPGARIPGIPAQSLKLRGHVEPAAGSLAGLHLGATLIAVSGQYAHGDEANRTATVPGHMLINADADWAVGRGIDLFVNLTNLFDIASQTYGVLGTNLYTAQAEQFRTPAPGRAVMAGVRWRFGPAARTAPTRDSGGD